MELMIIGVIVFVICIVIVISMAKEDDTPLAIFFGYIAIIAFIMAGLGSRKIGIEQGRMDVVTGKVKYELVTNPDSTRVWKEVKHEK